MKKTLVPLALFSFTLPWDIAAADTQASPPNLAVSYCGYSIPKSIIEKIENTKTENQNNITISTSRVRLDINGHQKYAQLIFSCYNQPPKTAGIEVRAISAEQEITDEDSGGRYYRVIEWNKPFNGANWKGTIAYVKSVFGETQKSPTPDSFYICPETTEYPCFSLTFDSEGSLKEKEALEIPLELSGIAIE